MARSYDLTSGSIPQHLLRLAAPLIMGNILQQLYNTVDAFILGRFAGDLEFAAVGVAGSVMNLFLFMITGACTGISVIFAQLYGADERERFRREHWRSLSCGLLVTLACSGLGFLLLSPLLRLIQTPSELKTFVSVYLTIILASLPAAFLYNLYGALRRAAACHRAGERGADGARCGGDGQCRARLLLCCALSVGHRGRGVGDGGVVGHFGGAVHPLPAAQGTGAHFCPRGLPYGWRAIEADGAF